MSRIRACFAACITVFPGFWGWNVVHLQRHLCFLADAIMMLQVHAPYNNGIYFIAALRLFVCLFYTESQIKKYFRHGLLYAEGMRPGARQLLQRLCGHHNVLCVSPAHWSHWRRSNQRNLNGWAIPLGTPAFLVWGANTGVGKSLISVGLAHASQRHRVRLLSWQTISAS